MKTKQQIQQEADSLYDRIVKMAKEHHQDYIQSWWFNKRNSDLGLTTPQINSRCRLLVRQGKLSIDHSRTSTSYGTCYRILDKNVLWYPSGKWEQFDLRQLIKEADNG